MNQIKENCTIGIDVSKEKLDIWVLPNNKHYIINNNARAIGVWFNGCRPALKNSRILIEPTGGYEKLLIKKLLDYGIQINMVHPNRLVHFAKSKGYDAKTDKLASMQPALYLKEQSAKAVTNIGTGYKASKQAQELSSRRRQLKDMLQAEQNRTLHEFFNKEIKRSQKRLIKQLKKELDKLDELIELEISKQENLNTKRLLLESFKGVGKVTSQALLLDVPELGTLSREAIAKLIGVAPLNNDSGKKSGIRHIRGGRGHVRKILYMSALVAIRHNSEIKLIFDRLTARGKVFKVAIVAVMRKMLCMLNSMIKKNVTWQQFIGLTAQKT